MKKGEKMEKLSRNNRVVIITKILVENPNKVIGLNRFSELLNAAKSTISEDIVIVREVLEKLEMGKLKGREWLVQGTSAINGQGVKEGLDWMVDVFSKKINN